MSSYNVIKIYNAQEYKCAREAILAIIYINLIYIQFR